jgi:hypothetical protein
MDNYRDIFCFIIFAIWTDFNGFYDSQTLFFDFQSVWTMETDLVSLFFFLLSLLPMGRESAHRTDNNLFSGVRIGLRSELQIGDCGLDDSGLFLSPGARAESMDRAIRDHSHSHLVPFPDSMTGTIPA